MLNQTKVPAFNPVSLFPFPKPILALLLLLSAGLLSPPPGDCMGTQQQEEDADAYRIAVFVPGVLEGSATYTLMDEGVRAAAEAHPRKATVKTVEGGFNQSEWPRLVTSLAAGGRYDLIVTSNPAMPEICLSIAEDFPEQQFLSLEGCAPPNDQVTTFLFNHRELAYTLGYLAGLITQSSMEKANPAPRVGMIAGQEYPVMNRAIRPGFREGLQKALPEAELDFRVLGNWYDAAKAGDLARGMMEEGCDVIIPIAGGANQGVVSAAREQGSYLLWYDTSGYEIAPGVIVGSGLLREDRGAERMVTAFLDGTVEIGECTRVGMAEGYMALDDRHPLYKESLPPEIREAMAELTRRFSAGTTALPMPELF